MSLISRLESKLGRYAPANVTAFLIAGQVVCFIADWFARSQGNPGVLESIQLVPAKVAEGEIWRLVTFLFTPLSVHPIFIIFAWYLFYLMGTTLENQWGAFRYNLYLTIGYVASLVLAFGCWALAVAPFQVATNAFLYGSVFLAFARLYPDFTLMLMFILPVKIKWLALFTWLIYGFNFIAGPWINRAMIVAAVLNYLLFFGREIWRDVKQGRRRMEYQSRSRRTPNRIVHKCRVCGLSSEDAPRTPFRYCTKCEGQCCYCPDHLANHEHVVKQRA
jgi:hypothetical protein